MRPFFNTGILLLALGGASALRADSGLPPGRGALLPLQDRVGEAQLTELAEALLRRELESQGDLVPATQLRAVLRDLRIRDASSEPPERLAALAERTGADWFFLATLHEAQAGRRAQREDTETPGTPRVEDAGDTPQVVLSARVFRHDSVDLWWAGFDAATGRDGERVFGLGEVEALEELLEMKLRELVARASAARGPGRARLRHREGGYRRAANPPAPPARVAVIPMDSVAELTPGASAEVVTAALFATLDDFGFKTLLPGLVQSLRQESGKVQLGAVSRSEWEALARGAEADWVATGTVETYRPGAGRDPDPWVAFAVRFLDPNEGRIDWLDGVERTGRDTAAAFDRGRIYSSGDLTYAMMRSLFARMQTAPATSAARGLGD